MKIMDILKKEFILEELKAKSKREVLVELAAVFARGKTKFDPEAMLHVLLEREKLGSTGIGDGIAIPHGKLAGLEEMVIAFGRSREGVDFEAMDGKPAHLFFLLMAPENSAGQHLKALAKISRMLKDAVFRKYLLAAKTHDDLYQALVEKDDEY
ncbi:MAG: PTS sugar transporter subunit IIA [Proteobacteria bacterium]|nr:PTS sugar transporter subunit IIA [Pseudomonadota bacterium]MBU4121356.1 PTS sugar transporter subunit IIA [Pseudomonadota bacterium]